MPVCVPAGKFIEGKVVTGIVIVFVFNFVDLQTFLRDESQKEKPIILDLITNKPMCSVTMSFVFKKYR